MQFDQIILVNKLPQSEMNKISYAKLLGVRRIQSIFRNPGSEQVMFLHFLCVVAFFSTQSKLNMLKSTIVSSINN
jgi:hypothetical protein